MEQKSGVMDTTNDTYDLNALNAVYSETTKRWHCHLFNFVAN